ncbi:MAG: hypothetical protein WDA42_08300 [Candidatus Bathyarchaeia archaeon]
MELLSLLKTEESEVLERLERYRKLFCEIVKPGTHVHWIHRNRHRSGVVQKISFNNVLPPFSIRVKSDRTGCSSWIKWDNVNYIHGEKNKIKQTGVEWVCDYKNCLEDKFIENGELSTDIPPGWYEVKTSVRAKHFCSLECLIAWAKLDMQEEHML